MHARKFCIVRKNILEGERSLGGGLDFEQVADLLRLELEVEASGESVQLDLASGEKSGSGWGGGHPGPGGGGCPLHLPENSGQMSGQISIEKLRLLMSRIVGVDERRGRNGIVVIFVVILLGLGILI